MRSSGRITVKRRPVAAYTAVPPSVSGGGGAADWRRAMFAFAVAAYPTIGTDFMVDFTQGSLGDYALAVPTNNGIGSYLTTVNGGALELDSGSTTVASTTIGCVGKGNPTLVANAKTGAPWFVASRARFNTAVIAGGQNLAISPTQINPFSAGAPALGMAGTTSLTNFVFTDGTANFDTGLAFALATFYDLAIGFDGTTLTAYIGQVMNGTLAAKSTSTTLTNVPSAPAQPGAIITISGSSTVRQLMDMDKLYAATALAA